MKLYRSAIVIVSLLCGSLLEAALPVERSEIRPAKAPVASAASSKTTGHAIVLEDGGTGPNSAIVTENATLAGMTIYRVVCNSGVLPEPTSMKGMPQIGKDVLQKYHSPVIYIMGGPTDIAHKNAQDDFAKISRVPVAMTNLDVGHGGTYSQPHGGEFTRVALAWLDWQLKSSAEASKLFLDQNGGLNHDPKWTLNLKNFPAK